MMVLSDNIITPRGTSRDGCGLNDNNNTGNVPEYRVGQDVEVMPRTWAGINKLGGVGHIIKIHYSEGYMTSVDVKYLVVGGVDTKVELEFVRPHQYLGRSKRTRKVDVKMNIGSTYSTKENNCNNNNNHKSKRPKKQKQQSSSSAATSNINNTNNNNIPLEVPLSNKNLKRQRRQESDTKLLLPGNTEKSYVSNKSNAQPPTTTTAAATSLAKYEENLTAELTAITNTTKDPEKHQQPPPTAKKVKPTKESVAVGTKTVTRTNDTKYIKKKSVMAKKKQNQRLPNGIPKNITISKNKKKLQDEISPLPIDNSLLSLGQQQQQPPRLGSKKLIKSKKTKTTTIMHLPEKKNNVKVLPPPPPILTEANDNNVTISSVTNDRQTINKNDKMNRKRTVTEITTKTTAVVEEAMTSSNHLTTSKEQYEVPADERNNSRPSIGTITEHKQQHILTMSTSKKCKMKNTKTTQNTVEFTTANITGGTSSDHQTSKEATKTNNDNLSNFYQNNKIPATTSTLSADAAADEYPESTQINSNIVSSKKKKEFISMFSNLLHENCGEIEVDTIHNHPTIKETFTRSEVSNCLDVLESEHKIMISDGQIYSIS